MKLKLKYFSLFLLVVSVFFAFMNPSLSQRGLENFRWIGDTGLALSGQPENQSEWDTLKSWGISAVVDLCREKEDNETYFNSIGIDYYWSPVTDGAWDITIKQVDDTVHWINSELKVGKKVLIHCAWGRGRAPTMAAMWYVHEGHTPTEAGNWIMQYPISSPISAQKQAVNDYYVWLQQQPEQQLPNEIETILLIFCMGAAVLVLAWRRDIFHRRSNKKCPTSPNNLKPNKLKFPIFFS